MSRRNSKLRVGWICPCVGVGGADAYMLGLCRYMHNVDFTGIAVQYTINPDNQDWMQKMIGTSVPIHQVWDGKMAHLSGINYHTYLANAIDEVAKNADILITWSVKDLEPHLHNIKIPIVELAQNCDDYAFDIASSNVNVVSHRVVVSESCMPVFGDEKIDAIINNAIDPGRVAPRQGRTIKRKLWGIEDDKRILLYMGRLVNEKCPSAVIQALINLPDNWLGIIVGRGYNQSQLIVEAQRYLDNPERLYFADPEYHVGDLLAASDVFILPSDFEGHPLTMLEAWLAGIPTVTALNNVMVEMREKYGELAHYVPLRSNGKILAQAVLQADMENEENFEIISRARTLTWQKWTLPTVATQWEEFLHYAVDSWRQRRMRGTIRMCQPEKPTNSSRVTVTTIDA